MHISAKIIDSIERSSWIRRMFEQGVKLKLRLGEEGVFDFSLGNPDLNPPEEFYSVLRGIIEDQSPGVHGYMPNAGFPDSRESIAKRVSLDHEIHIDGEHVIITCGAAGGLNIILKTILNPGEEVIVPKPYFAEYGFYIDNHQGRMILVDTEEDFSLNIEKIDKSITNKTKAILINSPNNPTGIVYSEDEIRELSGLLESYARKNRIIYLISDEPYREIVYDGIKVPSILKQYAHSIVVSSFSKTFSIPGERIGYIAVNPSSVECDMLMSGLILSNRILGFVNAPALMQRVVVQICDLSIDVDVYKSRRELLVNGLQEAGYEFTKPGGTFYLFCRSPISDDIKFVEHLQKYNILVVPGSGFGGPGYFRISFCVSEEVIRRALPKFKEAIDSIRR
ncbi:MAG: pyridoxal phosphate-dependent aminotransferase [Spirochaetota bacterium]|nr:pyridoxal phosphate-dependent aminotransferase [Spirochaetota bacterium]